MVQQLRAAAPESNLYWMPGGERPHEDEPPFIQTLMDSLNARLGLGLKDYFDLHRWSVESPAEFWDEMWKATGIIGERGSQCAYTPTSIEQPQNWFPGAKLSYAENVLLGHANARSTTRHALISCREPETANGKAVVMSRLSWAELYDQVRLAKEALSKMGVKAGDMVASFSCTNAEMVIAFLAANSLGAVYSSTPAEFGPVAVIDRFSQIQPKVIFTVDSTHYNGKKINVLPVLDKIIAGIGGVTHVVVVGHLEASRAPKVVPSKITGTVVLGWDAFVKSGASAPKEIQFYRGGFNDRLWVVFSSGTTGKPKAIIHSVGGMLLPRRVVTRFHINMDHRDVACQFTTMGWVMYNVTLGFLACGLTLITYDGSPFRPVGVLWDIIQDHKATYFGTSPRYLQALDKAKYYPRERNDISSLKVIAPTGAPVTPENYAFVSTKIKPLYLFNASGGTEIASSFVSGVPTLPIYRSELQVPTLGTATECLTENGSIIRDQPGALVVTRAFPNQPLGFVNDPDRKRFLASYFADYAIPVWSQSDYIRIASNTGGTVMLGRSDGILNPGGVRFGSSEIYNIVEMFPDDIEESICVGQRLPNQDERVILFLKLRPQIALDEKLRAKLKAAIVANLSVRHIPAVITACREIPVTTNGKKVETYVKKLLNGAKLASLDTSALANPECLAEYSTNVDAQLSRAKL